MCFGFEKQTANSRILLPVSILTFDRHRVHFVSITITELLDRRWVVASSKHHFVSASQISLKFHPNRTIRRGVMTS